MRPLYLALVVLLAIFVAYCGSQFFRNRPGVLDPAVLAAQALSAKDLQERQKATVELASVGPKGLDELRRVFKESPDPEVRATCAQALGDLGDYDSLEALIGSLNDETLLVRARAEKAIGRILRRDLHFPVEGRPDQRAAAQAAIRKTWEQLRDRSLLERIKQRRPLAYFFDRNTREIIEGPADGEELLETPSGPFHGRPAAVPAAVFRRQTADNPGELFVGYLILSEEAARRHGEKIAREPNVAGVTAVPTLVARPGEETWYFLATAEGQAITSEPATSDHGPGELEACSPDK